jgi:dTMP kinase
MFITFEGADGCGKSTQIALLRARLEAQGREVLVTREPGGTPVAEKIRALLLDRESDMDDMTEAYLYAAARADHVRRVILPALGRGCAVLCDRYLDSSLAYQGWGRGLTAQTVQEINRQAVGTCLPDRTYLMVLDPREADRRVGNRGARDRMESAGEAFARRVQEGFACIASQEPSRVVVLDASQPVEALARLIAQDVESLKV